jgi:hypothetical protein
MKEVPVLDCASRESYNRPDSMTAKQLLEKNGDFHTSPLLATARRLHAICQERGVPYCIVGGLAVVRNGAVRTTEDVDVLTLREAWATASAFPPDFRKTGEDSCVDTLTGVNLDVLFTGDDWGMVLPLADPRNVGEYDETLGAIFMSLPALVELKCAVYLQKLEDEGIELAAKDLSDVVELMRHNRGAMTRGLLDGLHPSIRDACRAIWEKVGRA